MILFFVVVVVLILVPNTQQCSLSLVHSFLTKAFIAGPGALLSFTGNGVYKDEKVLGPEVGPDHLQAKGKPWVPT